MEEKLDIIAQNLGKAIRKSLWDAKLFDNNIEIEVKIGRYLINFQRKHGKNEVLIEFPDNLMGIIMDSISQMNEVWMEDTNEAEILGDDTTSEYDIFIIVDGDPIELKDTREIENLIATAKKQINSAIESEDYERAARLRDKIKRYTEMIENN